jgi:hypothetical protein
MICKEKAFLKNTLANLGKQKPKSAEKIQKKS